MVSVYCNNVCAEYVIAANLLLLDLNQEQLPSVAPCLAQHKYIYHVM